MGEVAQMTAIVFRQHGWLVAGSVASQQKGSGIELWELCVVCACCPHVCVGFLRILRFHPSVQKQVRLLSNPDLSGKRAVISLGFNWLNNKQTNKQKNK